MAHKLVVTLPLAAASLALIQAAAPDWEVIHGSEDVWRPHLHDAEIAVVWSGAVLAPCLADEAARLRWVHYWGAGVDGLPLAELARRDIILTNSSGVHALPISETVLGLMLALTRKLDTYVRQQSTRTWHHAGLNLEMHGKTVAILGVGAIGGEVARLAQAFAMTTLGVRKSAAAHPHIDRMVGLESLATVLPAADYVVNTLPLTAATRHIIGNAAFAAMKPTAFYINIGRGATTQPDALVDALQNGRIAGAGLDVFDPEPLPSNHPLWALENVIITPHSSGSTGRYEERAVDIFASNLRLYVAGKPISNHVVDYQHEY